MPTNIEIQPFDIMDLKQIERVSEEPLSISAAVLRLKGVSILLITIYLSNWLRPARHGSRHFGSRFLPK